MYLFTFNVANIIAVLLKRICIWNEISIIFIFDCAGNHGNSQEEKKKHIKSPLNY